MKMCYENFVKIFCEKITEIGADCTYEYIQNHLDQKLSLFGIDSMEYIQLIVDIEELYGIELEEIDLAFSMKSSVKEVIDAIWNVIRE